VTGGWLGCDGGGELSAVGVGELDGDGPEAAAAEGIAIAITATTAAASEAVVARAHATASRRIATSGSVPAVTAVTWCLGRYPAWA
jgi:hypothetical protein